MSKELQKKKIDEINLGLETVKKQIDDERNRLDEFRARLKQINEEKDIDYPKFVELRKSLTEARNQMKTLDDKVAGAAAAKSRKERLDNVQLACEVHGGACKRVAEAAATEP